MKYICCGFFFKSPELLLFHLSHIQLILGFSFIIAFCFVFFGIEEKNQTWTIWTFQYRRIVEDNLLLDDWQGFNFSIFFVFLALIAFIAVHRLVSLHSHWVKKKNMIQYMKRYRKYPKLIGQPKRKYKVVKISNWVANWTLFNTQRKREKTTTTVNGIALFRAANQKISFIN